MKTLTVNKPPHTLNRTVGVLKVGDGVPEQYGRTLSHFSFVNYICTLNRIIYRNTNLLQQPNTAPSSRFIFEFIRKKC